MGTIQNIDLRNDECCMWTFEVTFLIPIRHHLLQLTILIICIRFRVFAEMPKMHSNDNNDAKKMNCIFGTTPPVPRTHSVYFNFVTNFHQYVNRLPNDNEIDYPVLQCTHKSFECSVFSSNDAGKMDGNQMKAPIKCA